MANLETQIKLETSENVTMNMERSTLNLRHDFKLGNFTFDLETSDLFWKKIPIPN